MTVSLRLNENDSMLIKNYALINNISISDLFRQAVLEKIEDEYDLQAFTRAIEEFKADPKTYTLDEVERELGLS